MKSSVYQKITFISGIFLFLISCSNGPDKGEAVDEEMLPEDIVELRNDQIILAQVEFGTAEMRQMGNVLKVNGIINVAPQNHASVCTPMGGFIKNTDLIPGSAVNKGQVLAIIENQDFIDIQQNYLESKNKLAFAEADYKRHNELYESDVYSAQNLQQVTVEYKNLKAQTKSLEQKVKLIGIDPENLREDNISSAVSLVSPIKGFLKSVNVNIGEYVSPADVLFEIVNCDKLFLELTLFEKDADKIKPGQKTKFFINNETEEHYATVTQTGKTVTDDKTFQVYAQVTSYCTKLLPGMYVNAFIGEDENKTLAVPSEAIVSFDDKDYIFIYEKEKMEEGKPFTEYRMVEVRKGITSSGYTAISLPENLNGSALKIVVKGAYNLLSAKKNAGEMAC